MARSPGLPVQRQGLRHATVVVLGPVLGLALGTWIALASPCREALIQGPEPSAGSAVAALPEEAVTFFGAGGSLLVGLAYLPSATALRNRGQALSDDLFPSV
jgi:hypothetical protein